MVVADVVGTALEQRHRNRRAQRRAHGWNVAQEQLVLQVLGAGRDDGLAAPQQRRHQVGERLAGAGARFGNQGFLVRNGLGDRLGHLGLRAARAESADRRRERAAGTEQAIDLGIVFAGRRGVLGAGSGAGSGGINSRIGGGGGSDGRGSARASRRVGIGQNGISVKRRQVKPEHPAPIASSTG